MARVQEFYKGRRKKKNLAIIPFIVLLALVSVTLVTFYGMQKYAVITKDGVSVELPILDDGSKQVTVDSQGNEVVNFERVDANIVFDAPDYSTVQASVGENVPELRAIFVPAENITQEKLNEYDLTIFVKEEQHPGEELFRRFQETHLQRGYELAEIKRFIEEAGMEFVRAYDAESLGEVTDTSERIYCIARERGK